MTLVITSFPTSAVDDPKVWRVTDDEWQDCGPISEFMPDVNDSQVMAIVAPADTRCVWSLLPDLEPRQAEGVARLQLAEQSLGPVHVVAKHLGETSVVAASVAPSVMQTGLARLAAQGLNPDIVIPAALVFEPKKGRVTSAVFDEIAVLRGLNFASPDELVFRKLFVGEAPVEDLDPQEIRSLLKANSAAPLVNFREGVFAKYERAAWANAEQRKWIVRLVVALIAVTLLLATVTFAKYWTATDAENDRALTAAQKISPSITEIAQAETQLGQALQQRGLAQSRLIPLSAGLWRAVQASPNVSVREMRYGADGILTVVLAAPNAESVNRALIAIQRDGYNITATPRRDTSGATLVDMTMRMP